MDPNVGNGFHDQRAGAMHWAWQLHGLNGPQRLLLVAMIFHSDEFVCLPESARLMTKTGLQREVYNNTILQLEDMKLITPLAPYAVPTYKVNVGVSV